METKKFNPRIIENEQLYTSTAVAIEEAKKTLASFSLDLENVLRLNSIENIKSKQLNVLYEAELSLYKIQEKVQTEFVELLKTKFASHSKYPNQINDLIEYINTKLKPNQHEVKILIDEAGYLHALSKSLNSERKIEIMNKLYANNIEIQKVFKMNLEDDLIQSIKNYSTETNRINKELDNIYAENKLDMTRSKIDKLIEERSLIAKASQKDLETLNIVQHKEIVKKDSVSDFNFFKTLSAIELPILARSSELRDILNKIQTVIENLLIVKP